MLKHIRIAYRRVTQSLKDTLLQGVIACLFFLTFMISYNIALFFNTAQANAVTVIAISDWQQTIIKVTKSYHDKQGWEREITFQLSDGRKIIRGDSSISKEENQFYNASIGQQLYLVV